MKNIYLCVVIISLLLALSSCGGDTVASDVSASSDDPNVIEDSSAEEHISSTSEIQQLDSGFSAVKYDGDYAFDLFLEHGGAASDQEVLQFLNEKVFGMSTGLQMGGDGFGCSTISVANTDGGYLFGRNFDWQACDAMVVSSYPAKGHASVSTVNLGFIKQGAGALAGMMSDEMLTVAALYAPLDGMNEKGLCVSVNMIQDSATIDQDNGKPDVTTTTAVRLMLDKAASVDEAIELLEKYDMHASMNYMIHFAIADNSGKSVAVEYVGNEMIVIETPILTNFYLAEGEKHGIGTAQSHERFEILESALKNNPTMIASQVRDVLDSVSKDNFGEFESTEWSVVFDETALTATYYHREDYSKAYSFKL